MHAQQQHLHQQQQQAASSSPQPPGYPSAPFAMAPVGGMHRPRREHVPPPRKFSGEVGGHQLDAWERELAVYFTYNNEQFGPGHDDERLRLVGTVLEGAALIWWLTVSTPPSTTIPTTWDACIAMFHARFRPVLAATIARQKLAALTQGRRSVTEYSSQFQTIHAAIPDMAAADQVFAYIRGLQPAIGTKVFERNPATVADAILIAAMAEGLRTFLGPALGTDAHHRPAPHSSTGAGTAMDLCVTDEGSADSSHSSDPTLARLAALDARIEQLHAMNARSRPRDPSTYITGIPASVITQRMAANQCFKCGKVGHRKAECKGKVNKNPEGGKSTQEGN